MLAPPPPGREEFHDPIRLADWVELNLLIGDEPNVSLTTVADELTLIPPDDSDESEMRFDSDVDPSEGGTNFKRGFRETAETQAESAFLELTSREGWLGDRYPLEIDSDVASFREETPARDVYEFLVLLRSRQLYRDALDDDGAESGLLFEELVKYAISNYVGARAGERVRFGVAGGSRGDGLPASLSEALQELSDRMSEKLGEVPTTGDGDFKADAIAWRPFGDDGPGQLVMIGQATISEGDWIREEPPNRWTDRTPPDRRLILFFSRPITAVAFPETLSLTRRAVLDGLSFSSIPFDRLRIASILSDEDLPEEMREKMRDWSVDMKGRLPD